MKTLFALLLLTSFTACSSPSNNSTPSNTNSTLIIMGYTPKGGPANGPAKGDTVFLQTAQGAAYQMVILDSLGQGSFSVPAGTYQLNGHGHWKMGVSIFPNFAKLPVTITLPASGITRDTLEFNSLLF